MRLIVLVILLVAAAPASSALVVYTGVITNVTAPFSAPAYYSSVKYPVDLGPGDDVSVSLAYASTPTRDLDLLLFSPFHEAVILGVDTAEHYVAQREARATCTDATGASQAHPDGGAESFRVALPPTAEAGEYALYVLAYHHAEPSPYELAVSILDGGGDEVTSDRVGVPAAARTANPWIHCDALMRPST